ncbi:MAG: glycerophosphodiester phosphodiesterase family protein [Pseudomonadota bacterium]
MTSSLPSLIAHRGAAGLAPENTMESVVVAIHAGAQFVSCTVRMTKDGVAILMADETLDRTTNGHGHVSETAYDDINALEAGSWHSDHFAGLSIPTLAEVLDECINRNVGLLIELRPTQGKDSHLAEAALDVISRVVDDPSQILIASRSPAILEIAMDMAPEYPRAIIFDHVAPDNWPEIVAYLKPGALILNIKAMPDAMRDGFVDTGLPLIAAVINNAVTAQDLLGHGFTSVLSDVPDLLHHEN